MTTFVDRSFSFLTSGPRFVFGLPDDFEGLPELSSPIVNGIGARSFVFYPRFIEPDLLEVGRLLDTLLDRDGRPVELLERMAPPLVWWLRWPLSSGSLTTHLRLEDGVGEIEGVQLARETVAGLTVTEDPNDGAPFLLLDPPLSSGVSAEIGYEEYARFYSPTRGWLVKWQRPGFLRTGKVVLLPNPDAVLFRAGAEFGMEVQVTAGDDEIGGRSLILSVLQSLREASEPVRVI